MLLVCRRSYGRNRRLFRVLGVDSYAKEPIVGIPGSVIASPIDTSNAGRAYTAYGGVCTPVSIARLRIVEGVIPDRWDVVQRPSQIDYVCAHEKTEVRPFAKRNRIPRRVKMKNGNLTIS